MYPVFNSPSWLHSLMTSFHSAVPLFLLLSLCLRVFADPIHVPLSRRPRGLNVDTHAEVYKAKVKYGRIDSNSLAENRGTALVGPDTLSRRAANTNSNVTIPVVNVIFPSVDSFGKTHVNFLSIGRRRWCLGICTDRDTVCSLLLLTLISIHVFSRNNSLKSLHRPQIFSLVLDTGSADLWVAGIDCTTCPPSQHLFNFTNSSSFVIPTADLNKRVNIKYGQGNVSGTFAAEDISMGQFVLDNQTFGDFTVAGQRFGESPTFTFTDFIFACLLLLVNLLSIC